MQIETSTLTGNALNFCVAMCEGYDAIVLTLEDQRNRWIDSLADAETIENAGAEWDDYFADSAKPKICIRGEEDYKRTPYHNEAVMIFGQGIPCFQYDKSWAQAGPIIDREDIDVLRDTETDFGARLSYASKHPNRDAKSYFCQRGPTKLIAAMRCYVASKMGEVVEIPDELCY